MLSNGSPLPNSAKYFARRLIFSHNEISGISEMLRLVQVISSK